MWYKKLHNQIFIGIIFGVLLGIFLPSISVRISFIGDLFVSALKMIVAPLILSSIFVGISSIGDIRKIGSLGKQTVIYYLVTTFMAVLIGIIVVNIIQPSKNSNYNITKLHSEESINLLKKNDLTLGNLTENKIAKEIIFNEINSEAENIPQFIDNKDFNDKILSKITSDINKKIVISLYSKEKQDIYSLKQPITKENKGKLQDILKLIGYRYKINYKFLIESINRHGIKENESKIKNYIESHKIITRLKSRGFEITDEDVKRTISTINTKKSIGDAFLMLANQMLENPFKALSEGNAIGIIFFALLLGAFASILGSTGEPVVRFMNGFNDVIFKIVDLIIKIAPIGVFSLIATLVGQNSGDPQKLSFLLYNVGDYMLTVLIGLFIHGFIVLPILLYFFGKMNPIKFFMGMRSPLLTAFSTCTSSGTLPLTFKATQDNLKLSKRVTDFVLPLGATVNMDGTALYESVAAIFIANYLGFDLTIADQVIIFFTASIAAIGAAAIPSAGLITMTIVLSAVGLPTSGIAIIIAVDRILDMFRTAINVEGDAVGSVIISRLQDNNIKLVK
ncbi:MAG: dicarboxylate/amino acid:cation symporter [Spirochaetota bacterium]|nr:dicarboxylate/amino acid:cation symporter [Spirochaetota bacterium]